MNMISGGSLGISKKTSQRLVNQFSIYGELILVDLDENLDKY